MISTNGALAAPFVHARRDGLRHNQYMPRIPAIATCIILLLPVGCESAKPPVVDSSKAGVDTPINGIEFSGERSCVDCDGIESWLRLEQAGNARRYRMVEVFYGQDHQRRFEDSGEWSSDGNLLRLRSTQGGERVYARVQEGYLQARGAHGQRIAAAEDEVLVPAGLDSTR